jgi:AdoMet-dependent heme synthase
VCSVLADGRVSPCALLGDGFVAGSLDDASLLDLWSKGDPFVRLRGLKGNPQCWSCRHYDRCGGGCRARTLATGGDLDAPDPWCGYEPKA